MVTQEVFEHVHHLRVKSWALLHETSGFVMSERLRELNDRLMKYSPDQPRVPAGQRDGGQWTSGVGGGGFTDRLNAIQANHTRKPDKLPDDAIEPVYPIETLIAAIYARPVLIAIRTALIVRRAFSSDETANSGFTTHGAIRSGQRTISRDEIREARRTALENGNVTTKLGKYGAPQSVYIGSNGVTVVVESSGRNAGKIITLYRH
jgi:hypothetical protein